MRFSLLLIAGFLATITSLHAQINLSSFNAEVNSNPLYIFLEQEEEPTEKYLLEKKATTSPDQYTQNPIGLSLSHFKNINLKDTKNNCSFFSLKDDSINKALGSTFSNTPELSFFEDRLYKVKFYIDNELTSNSTSLKKLNEKFGKPKKNKYELNDGSLIREYIWEGYKVNISFIVFEEGTNKESVIVVEDELVGKLAIADQENKTFVKEAKLYSDIETLMRYK